MKVRCPVCAKRVRTTDADQGHTVVCPACGNRFDAPHAGLLNPNTPIQGEPAAHETGLAASEFVATDTSVIAAAASDVEGWTYLSGGPALSKGPPPPTGPPPALHRAAPAAPAYDSAPATRSGAVHESAGILPPLNPAPSREEVLLVLDEIKLRRRHWHPLWWLAAGVCVSAAVLLTVIAWNRASDHWEQENRLGIVDLIRKAQFDTAAGNLDLAHRDCNELDKLVDGRQITDEALGRLINTAHENDRRGSHGLFGGAKPSYGLRLPPSASVATSASRPSAAPLANPAPALAPRPAERPAPADHSAQPVQTHAESPASAPVPPPPPIVQRPIPRTVADNPDVLTDAIVGRAIQKGVDYLLEQFDSTAHTLHGTSRPHDPSYVCGEDALAVYALLQSGQAVNDQRLLPRAAEMDAMISALKEMSLEGRHQTYARGLRATALALYNRPEDFTALKEDATVLIAGCDAGAYTYVPTPTPNGLRGNAAGNPVYAWDNSNSQYGLLGVWSAADAEPRIEVPSEFWRAIERHWTHCQTDSGPWGYTLGNPRQSMTCAGIASLFVSHDYLDPATPPQYFHKYKPPQAPSLNPVPTGRDPFSPPLTKGLDWFEQGDNSVRIDGGWYGYNLYGVERVGLASGFKFFGRHDWYRELGADTVADQRGNGSWNDATVDTAYALLFLSRGRHPIIMNKLRFDGHWSNRPRDIANLSRYSGRQLERPFNWQIVNVKLPWTDWNDSPILYLASEAAPTLSDDDVNRIRRFVYAGGLLFTHADSDSASFNLFAQEFSNRLFGKYELVNMPLDHLVYTVNFKLTARPQLKYVTNGARVLMIHSPTDLSTHWQRREDRPYEGLTQTDPVDPVRKGQVLGPFQFGENLYIYAAGKKDFRNRLSSNWVAPVDVAPLSTMTIARLKYAGNWDPEPMAWERYGNWLQKQTDYQVVTQIVELKDLRDVKPADIPIAHLTGTARQSFTAEEMASVRLYVKAGGVLLIDQCGGTGLFDESVSDGLLRSALPESIPQAISMSHPLMTQSGPGMDDLSRINVRPFTVERLGHSPRPPSLLKAGKGHVIYSPLDLTEGILHADAWGIIGYEPAYSEALMKNLIFWTLDGQPDARPDMVTTGMP